MSYPPPPHGYGQPGYGQQPPYPPQQQPYGYGPPAAGGYPPPQQPGYPPQGYAQQPPPVPPHPGHSPHPQSPYPPQQPYGAPPGQYPPQPHSPYSPQPYGAPSPIPGHPPAAYPPQPYGAPIPGHPPAMPSPGYIPGAVPQTDMQGPAAALRDAMKGFGTNEKKLIDTLAAVPDAPHMLKLRYTYDDRFRRSLIKDLESETSGYFRDGLSALCRGPLLQDAFQVDKAIRGLGTKESLLNDVVLGRSNADLNAIKACYTQVFGKDMVKEIRDDLSLKTERLFEYVLAATRAEESTPVLPQDVEREVDRLQQATSGTKFGANQDVVSQVMSHASNGMIRAINIRYQAKFRMSLDDAFKREFSGHMKDALRLMVARAVDPVKADADQLEAAMAGMGTKDELLVTRLVRAHWDRNHFRQVKAAYQKFHHRDLATRVSGETSGDYKRLMVALCQ